MVLRSAALLTLGVLLLAGCTGAPAHPASVMDLPISAEGFVVHRADGSVLDPSTVLEPLVATLRTVGESAFEPTLGVDSEGRVFYAATQTGVAIGYKPLVMRSDDSGTTWMDVSPRVADSIVLPPETNDPFVYVDEATNRVFQFAMAPALVCSILSWSDNAGESWTTNPHGCGNTPPWDHQSMVAARPRTVRTEGYENVLVQCVNNGYASSCSRSLDGGMTWLPGAPAFVDSCSGLHGHPVAHPDGTIFLPKVTCGGELLLAYSENDGLAWSVVNVAEGGHDWPDPAMAVDADGNAYYAWISTKGELLFSISTDVGRTWSTPIVASPPGLTAHLPAIAAGDTGKLVFAYPATPDLPQGYDENEETQEEARWYGYLTVVADALSPEPTFMTTRAGSLDDPLVRGPCGPKRCPGMGEFIDVVVGPDGRPYASFVDACSSTCARGEDPNTPEGAALLATLIKGPLLREQPESDS